MTGGADGYFAGRDYPRTFQEQMAPAHLRCLLLLRRRRAFDPAAPFRYLELGCGSGFTATLIAAANPGAEVIGVDLSPAHVVQARDLAAEAGIANVRFLEASFAELLEAPEVIGEVDFAALHGVYTWVSGDNRRRIVELLRRHVAPGGLVYLAYNAMPGWAPIAPLRHLVRRLAEGAGPDGAEAALAEAQAVLAEMQAANAGYMAGNGPMARWLADMAERPAAYLAHEYMPEAGGAAWHDEVARDLGEARLSYVGSARLVENFDSIAIPGPLRARVAAAAARGQGEMLRDLATNRSFRMDVFARGAPPAGARAAEAAFAALPLATDGPPLEAPSIRAPHGRVPLAPAVAGPVHASAAEGPATVAEVLARAARRGVAEAAARQALTALIAGGRVLPLATLSPGREAAARCDAFNRLALARAAADEALPALASPLAGGGVALPAAEQRALAGAGSAGPEDDAPARLAARRVHLARLGLPAGEGG